MLDRGDFQQIPGRCAPNSKTPIVSDLYIAKVSEENHGALGMSATGQDRLTESSACLKDVLMKRVFETAECEAVRSSIFWELRYEKHENQMKGCGVELRVRDWCIMCNV